MGSKEARTLEAVWRVGGAHEHLGMDRGEQKDSQETGLWHFTSYPQQPAQSLGHGRCQQTRTEMTQPDRSDPCKQKLFGVVSNFKDIKIKMKST